MDCRSGEKVDNFLTLPLLSGVIVNTLPLDAKLLVESFFILLSFSLEYDCFYFVLLCDLFAARSTRNSSASSLSRLILGILDSGTTFSFFSSD